jgi:hypothetical protein
MNKKIAYGSILVIIMLVSPLSVVAQTQNIKLQTNETKTLNDPLSDILNGVTEEQLNELIEFFRIECPSTVPSLRQALNKAKICDLASGEVRSLNLATLENELEKVSASKGRNKLRFFRRVCIEAEPNTYEFVRTPSDPFWGGPILADYVIKWSIKSDSYKVKCYDNWWPHGLDVPEPRGSPVLYCKKVWFHDWSGLHSTNNELIGVVWYLWGYGRTTESVSVQQPKYQFFTKTLSKFQVFEQLLQNNPFFQRLVS